MVAEEFKGDVEIGSIHIGDHCIVGANSTILPNVTLSTGASVGANCLVKHDLEGWCLFAGAPVRRIKERNAKIILALEQKFRNSK
jgi:acetyltransferase-like isoleucine patch superfamily enzyme